MSDLNVTSFLPLVEILARAGVDAIERRAKRKVSTMTIDEIKTAAAELKASIRPWDEPQEEPEESEGEE